MKKLLYLIFFIGILPITTIHSQNFPCDEPCTNPILIFENITLNYTSTCSISVMIEKKVCNNGKVVIRILDIPSFDLIGCGYPPSRVVVIMVLHSLIRDNPLNLTEGEHVYKYPSCWAIQPSGSVVPCNTECCEIRLIYEEVCESRLPKKIIYRNLQYCINNINNEMMGCESPCSGVEEYFEANLRELEND